MAAAKPKKPTREEVDLLKSEVASFASSLGLAPPDPTSTTSGFDDSDFQKSGPIKPSKTPKTLTLDSPDDVTTPAKKKTNKPHPLQIDPFARSANPKDPPTLPLMKAGLLSGLWHADADELEARVLGKERTRRAVVGGVEEVKALAEKKREVGERLMEQYTREYEATRRKSGDMRLLETTARSGTSADKVSAFTCLVEDNPIANLRSLDALLGKMLKNPSEKMGFLMFIVHTCDIQYVHCALML